MQILKPASGENDLGWTKYKKSTSSVKNDIFAKAVAKTESAMKESINKQCLDYSGDRRGEFTSKRK